MLRPQTHLLKRQMSRPQTNTQPHVIRRHLRYDHGITYDTPDLYTQLRLRDMHLDEHEGNLRNVFMPLPEFGGKPHRHTGPHRRATDYLTGTKSRGRGDGE